MKLSDCLNLMTFSENFASDSSILRKLQKYNYGSKLFNSKEKDAEYELLSPTKYYFFTKFVITRFFVQTDNVGNCGSFTGVWESQKTSLDVLQSLIQ